MILLGWGSTNLTFFITSLTLVFWIDMRETWFDFYFIFIFTLYMVRSSWYYYFPPLLLVTLVACSFMNIYIYILWILILSSPFPCYTNELSHFSPFNRRSVHCNMHILLPNNARYHLFLPVVHARCHMVLLFISHNNGQGLKLLIIRVSWYTPCDGLLLAFMAGYPSCVTHLRFLRNVINTPPVWN